MFSIDQNSHSLWDVLPKLQALLRHGRSVRHFVEDVDVAFTWHGAHVPEGMLRVAREVYHRSGGSDWGAALFYSEFLGRLPVEIRGWEEYTGLKTHVLAGQLGRSVDDLYEEFSPGDNWQLIGPSYVGDHSHHRVIGDLTVAETAGAIRRILRHAREDSLRAFPERPSRQRLTEWFAREEARVEELLRRCEGGKLVDLYRLWLNEYLGGAAPIDATSSLFSLRAAVAEGDCGGRASRTCLMEAFACDYDRAADLYNRAIAETHVGLRRLKTGEGELPFFATLEYQGHLVRTGVFLRENEIRISDKSFALRDGRLPLEDFVRGGILCLAGKAILLVIQARLGAGGAPLALPFHGSLYMPASRWLEKRLVEAGLLLERPQPVVRVRFRLLDCLRSLGTTIRLPPHLAACFGREEIPARELGENYASLAEEASRRLDSLRSEPGRQRWQWENLPRLAAGVAELDKRRRELAARDAAPAEIRPLWKEMKALRTELLQGTLEQIARDDQVRRIDYWDSRGALLPWCVGLGGESLYNELLDNAEVYEEP